MRRLHLLFSRVAAVLSFDAAHPSRTPRAALLVGAGIVLLLFARPLFFDLGRDHLDNDEAIYSHAVHGMVEADRWASPWSSPGTGPFLEKPPLKMWLVAAGIRFLGLPLDETGLRFWDPVFGTVALLYLFALGARFGGPLAGVGAAGALFVSERIVIYHGLRSNDMDSLLVAAYCGGAWHLLAWARSEIRSRGGARHFLAASAWTALGFGAKFVAVLFLPFTALILLLDPRIRRRLLAEAPLIGLGAALFLAIVAPWFLLQHVLVGAAFWQEIFGTHVTTRFTSSLDPTHVNPWSYYFVALHDRAAEGGLRLWAVPGLLAFVGATVVRRSSAGLFVLAWAVVPMSLISLGSSKLEHYLYPFLPPWALFAGCGFALGAGLVTRAVGRIPGLRRPGHWPRVLSPVALVIAALGLWVLGSQAGERPVPAISRNPTLPALASAAGLAAAPVVGPELLAASAILAVLPRPAQKWWNVVDGLDEQPTAWKDLLGCLREGRATTWLGDSEETLVFLHARRDSPLTHTVYYYLQRAPRFQQQVPLDPALLAFRLWVGRHRSVVAVPEVEWRRFLEDTDLRLLAEQVRSRAERAGLAGDLGESDLERIAGGDLPLSGTIDDVRIFLPGEYAACAPTVFPPAPETGTPATRSPG